MRAALPARFEMKRRVEKCVHVWTWMSMSVLMEEVWMWWWMQRRYSMTRKLIAVVSIVDATGFVIEARTQVEPKE